jgi:hypothetical protein
VPTDRKEAHERAEYRSQLKRDTFETVAAERVKELEVLRQRTAELRKLRLSQEKRTSPAPKKKAASRAAKSGPKGKLSDWLETQEKSGRKT